MLSTTEIKFIADAHLGKLARYLRLCGFDTLYDISLTDGQIIDISLSENRIILSKDKELLGNKRVITGLMVFSQKPDVQLSEVVEKLELKHSIKPFTRCMDCNGLLMHVSKEEISKQLLPDTRSYYTKFQRCTKCLKIYWDGSHYARMKNFLNDL